MKSVSLLWALGGPEVRPQVEAAHHEAVASTIGWVEQHAAFTRTGHGGTAQVDTTGLVAAAFDHRESRSGDPDLHTHVAVANKVCRASTGSGGRWTPAACTRSGSPPPSGTTPASRTRLAAGSASSSPSGRAGTRRSGPVREIVGVPIELVRHFSRRRAAIEDRYAELLRDYRARARPRARPADPAAAGAAGDPGDPRGQGRPARTLAEQVADWTDRGRTVLGRTGSTGCCGDRSTASATDRRTIERAEAGASPAEVGRDRLRAAVDLDPVERLRRGRTRPARPPVPHPRGPGGGHRGGGRARRPATGAVDPDRANPSWSPSPTELRRASDGQSVFVAARRRAVHHQPDPRRRGVAASTAAVDPRRRAVDPLVAEAALAVHEADHRRPRSTTGSGSLVELLRHLPGAARRRDRPRRGREDHRDARPAPRSGPPTVDGSSRSRPAPRPPQVLGDELGLRAENLHKFLHENQPHRDTTAARIRGSGSSAGDVVLVDEAGMAGTLQLAELVDLASDAGASVRLLGDPAQLAASTPAARCGCWRPRSARSTSTSCTASSTPTKRPPPCASGPATRARSAFYAAHDRIRAGSREAMLEAAYDGWATDIRAGLHLGADRRHRRRRHRAQRPRPRRTRRRRPGRTRTASTLRDDNRAGVGDWVVTRTNLRAPDLPPRPGLGQERRHLAASPPATATAP